MESFADVLHYLMAMRGMGQTDLARHSGIPQPALSKMMNGRQQPLPAAVDKLARGMGLSADDKQRLSQAAARAMGFKDV
jgi:transcriptional regulator with XRE-family HTH domain